MGDFFLSVLYVATGLGVVIGIILFWVHLHQKEKKKQTENKILHLAKNKGINLGKIFVGVKYNAVGISQDNDQVVMLDSKICRSIPIAGLLEIEIRKDNSVLYSQEIKQGGLARAAVGGVLFGGAGAIVGAATAGTSTDTISAELFEAHLSLSDPEHPHFSIVFNTFDEAKNLQASLKAAAHPR